MGGEELEVECGWAEEWVSSCEYWSGIPAVSVFVIFPEWWRGADDG